MISKFAHFRQSTCLAELCRKTSQKQYKTMARTRISLIPGKSLGGDGDSGCCGGKRTVVFKEYEPPCYEDHDRKNMRLGKPMSPHLNMVAPTLPAMTSIVQRIFGIINTCYILILSCGALFLSDGIDTYVNFLHGLDMYRFIEIILKFLISFVFCYHYCNGIRYCFWTLGRFLSTKSIYYTAYLSMAVAICGSAYLAIFT